MNDTLSYTHFQKQVTLTAGGGDTVENIVWKPKGGHAGVGRGSMEQGGRRPVEAVRLSQMVCM